MLNSLSRDGNISLLLYCAVPSYIFLSIVLHVNLRVSLLRFPRARELYRIRRPASAGKPRERCGQFKLTFYSYSPLQCLSVIVIDSAKTGYRNVVYGKFGKF